MGSPTIFSGRRTKLLTPDALLMSDGSINDNNGVVNYIKNGHAEVNTVGWATYADLAGATPVDGIGGSPTLTWTRSTTLPLSGQGLFLLSKSASNLQGQGASCDFTIDRKDQAKVLSLSFDYIINSGTFVPGIDLTVWIYDVTNAVLIQPSSFNFLSNSTTIADKFSATFQSASNSVSYRLIFHVSSVSALAYVLGLDSISVSPSVYAYGTVRGPVGSVIYTGSLTPPTGYLYADGTAISRTLYDKLFASIGTTYGVGDGSTTFNIPNLKGVFLRGAGSQTIGGFSSASTLGTTQGDQFQGHNHTGTGAGSNEFIFNRGSGGVYATLAGGSVLDRTTVPAGTASTDGVNGTPRVGTETRPANVSMAAHICFDAGSVQMSDKADTRIVVGKARFTTAKTSSPTAPLNFDTIIKDTHGGFTTGASWGYTSQVQGTYDVGITQMASGTTVTTYIYKNNVSLDALYTHPFTAGNGLVSGKYQVDLNVGDYIDFRHDANVASANGYMSISRVSGPSAIAASESVNASYYCSANFTSSSTIPINFDSKEFDSHGSVSTSPTAWKFKAPISGTYQVGLLGFAGGTYAFRIYKNGTNYKNVGTVQAGVPSVTPPLIRLLADDYIDIRTSTSITVAGGALSADSIAMVSIIRVGN